MFGRIAEALVRRALVGRHEDAARLRAAEQPVAAPRAVRHVQRRVEHLVLQLDADQRLLVAVRQADPLDQAVLHVQHIGGHLDQRAHLQVGARNAHVSLGPRFRGGQRTDRVGHIVVGGCMVAGR